MNIRQAKATLLIFTYIFVMFLLPTVSYYVLAAVFHVTNEADINVYANFISYAVLVVVSLALFGRELVEQYKKIPSLGNYLKGIGIGWIILFIASYISSIVVIMITQSQDSSANQQAIMNLMGVHPILMAITTVFFAPLTEEVVFRLTIMRSLINYPWVGILLSSFLFGMIHVISAGDFVYLIQYMAMGVALGYAYHKNQNIWFSIGVHLIQNLISTLTLLLL